MKTIFQLVESCQSKVKILEEMIPITQYQNRISEIDAIINEDNFWDNSKNASIIMKERQKLSDLVDKISLFKTQSNFYSECLSVMPDELSNMLDELNSLENELIDLEFKLMLQDPLNDNPAIITISAGAGGLEAANWVTMLLRMYLRYAESFKFNVELLDMKTSDEHSSICTDSASIRVEGKNAYGFLKGESGVHRLIRNSPFSSSDNRHTSFAAVCVTPDIEDIIDIKIDDKDIDVVARTAGGSGGQHQNKVCSAVRLRHFPTGINILVRAERDFHANKKTAFKMLKAKLYDLELKKREAEANKNFSELSDVSFGHQIRTYTYTPYSLVKDHRTDYEDNNIQSVLDGDIQEILLSYLRWKI